MYGCLRSFFARFSPTVVGSRPRWFGNQRGDGRVVGPGRDESAVYAVGPRQNAGVRIPYARAAAATCSRDAQCQYATTCLRPRGCNDILNCFTIILSLSPQCTTADPTTTTTTTATRENVEFPEYRRTHVIGNITQCVHKVVVSCSYLFFIVYLRSRVIRHRPNVRPNGIG